MTSFRHIIATRFNVRIPEYDAVSADWLEHRFELFERFCLPSAQSQSNQNFDWILFCDRSMSPVFRNRLEGYQDCRACRVVFINEEFSQAVVQQTVAELADGHSHLITTRLDNDDAICRTFVEVLQRQFDAQGFEFLNFTQGYVWRDGKAFLGRHRSNSFISLVERAEGATTVYCGNHMLLRSLGPIRQIEEPPGWLQIVHDRNLSNQVWGSPRPIEELHGAFGISLACLRPEPTR